VVEAFPSPLILCDERQRKHDMELENKSIIITGASSGIGAAAARLFAEEGANLVLGARRSVELEALAATINSGGGRAVYLAGDVADESYAGALVDLAASEFGGGWMARSTMPASWERWGRSPRWKSATGTMSSPSI
jgi:NADPH:quinone reductase-like Zn-dependent oxidoreductase